MKRESLPSGSNVQIVQSVTRALEILEIVARAGAPVGLSDISEATRLPMPTIHRLLHTLISSGYVYQTRRRRYTLGTRLIPLSRYAGGALGIALRPIIDVAVDELDESVSVAMLDQDFARYIAHVPSERTRRMFAEVGNQVSLHATAVGKAILAAMPLDQREAVVARSNLRSFTKSTIVDPAELLGEVARVRKRGYAVDNGEHEVGIRCVAMIVPGDLYLAASVSAPPERIHIGRLELEEKILPVLRKLTKSIARALDEYNAQAEMFEQFEA